jgi:hypothetical protein
VGSEEVVNIRRQHIGRPSGAGHDLSGNGCARVQQRRRLMRDLTDGAIGASLQRGVRVKRLERRQPEKSRQGGQRGEPEESRHAKVIPREYRDVNWQESAMTLRLARRS